MVHAREISDNSIESLLTRLKGIKTPEKNIFKKQSPSSQLKRAIQRMKAVESERRRVIPLVINSEGRFVEAKPLSGKRFNVINNRKKISRPLDRDIKMIDIIPLKIRSLPQLPTKDISALMKKPCPDDKIRNPKTGRCIKIENKNKSRKVKKIKPIVEDSDLVNILQKLNQLK